MRLPISDTDPSTFLVSNSVGDLIALVVVLLIPIAAWICLAVFCDWLSDTRPSPSTKAKWRRRQ
jgi:hypothetical protein